MSNVMKCISFNVRGLKEYKKRKNLFNEMHHTKADFMLLQETHVDSNEFANQISKEWGGRTFHSLGANDSRGVSILVNPQCSCEVIHEIKDDNGRMIILVVKLLNKTIVLANIYAPNKDDISFFEMLIEKIEENTENDLVIIGGDFNLVMNPNIDRKESLNNHHKSATMLKEYCEKSNMCDVWRANNCEERRYTWHRSKKGGFSASRIDMFLISQAYVDCSKCQIEPGKWSDHSMVILEIKLLDIIRGPGVWRLNNQLLSDSEYVDKINLMLDTMKQRYPTLEPDEYWLQLKADCAEFSKTYSKEKASKKKDEVYSLSETLKRLYKEIDRCKENKECETIEKGINQISSRLEVLQQEKTEACIFRSKCKYTREGEKSSKYFFSLEKKRYREKNMYCLVKENGEEIREPLHILKEQADYYEQLYKSDPKTYFKLKRNDNDPKLNEPDKIYGDSDLLVDELFDAVMTLKSNKCCGGDGLSVEFYRCFFKRLKIPLHEMYIDAKSKGILPESTRRGMISLLPKKNSNTKMLKHKRPLTLTNSDYKILAKAFDNRIKCMIDSSGLISEHQTGFLPNRNIAVNVRKSLDVMEFCKMKNIPACILSLDMSKCFDRVEYHAIYGALRFFNFGEELINGLHCSILIFKCVRKILDIIPNGGRKLDL